MLSLVALLASLLGPSTATTPAATAASFHHCLGGEQAAGRAGAGERSCLLKRVCLQQGAGLVFFADPNAPHPMPVTSEAGRLGSMLDMSRAGTESEHGALVDLHPNHATERRFFAPTVSTTQLPPPAAADAAAAQWEDVVVVVVSAATMSSARDLSTDAVARTLFPVYSVLRLHGVLGERVRVRVVATAQASENDDDDGDNKGGGGGEAAGQGLATDTLFRVIPGFEGDTQQPGQAQADCLARVLVGLGPFGLHNPPFLWRGFVEAMVRSVGLENVSPEQQRVAIFVADGMEDALARLARDARAALPDSVAVELVGPNRSAAVVVNSDGSSATTRADDPLAWLVHGMRQARESTVAIVPCTGFEFVAEAMTDGTTVVFVDPSGCMCLKETCGSRQCEGPRSEEGRVHVPWEFDGRLHRQQVRTSSLAEALRWKSMAELVWEGLFRAQAHPAAARWASVPRPPAPPNNNSPRNKQKPPRQRLPTPAA